VCDVNVISISGQAPMILNLGAPTRSFQQLKSGIIMLAQGLTNSPFDVAYIPIYGRIAGQQQFWKGSDYTMETGFITKGHTDNVEAPASGLVKGRIFRS